MMNGVQWMQLQDISNLTEEEIEQLLLFSSDKDTIMQRYIVACDIISNLLTETLGIQESLYPEIVDQFEDSIDLTICKMLMDGDVVVETLDRKLH